MSPEQRLVRAIWDDICDRSGFDLGALDEETQGDIRQAWTEIAARVLRAERNAALERAAKVAGDWIGSVQPGMRLGTENRIRSLKSRAPKRKAGRA